MKFNGLVIVSFLLICSILTGCSNLDIEKLNKRANELMNAGDIDGAISRLESINDLNPNFSQTHYNLGVAYYKKKNYEKAITSLNKAIRLKSDFAEAYYTLGVIYEEIGINIIEENKKPDSKKIVTIIDSFKLAQEAYGKYVQFAKSQSDADSINSKIETLNKDIQNYNKMLENN